MKNSIKSIVALSVAATFFIGVAVAADAQKIGVVDMQKVVQQSPQTAKFNADLEKNFKARQAKLVQANKDLQAERDHLSRDTAVMSAKDRQALQDKINKDTASLREDAQKYQNDLNTARTKDMQDLMGKIETAVNKVAKDGNFDVIIEKQAVPFVNSQNEITDKVVKALS